MRGALAIAVEELRTHRLALWAGLGMGLPPLAAAAYGARGPEPFYLAAGAGAVAMAIILGASVVPRDIAERRLGFYLSRPLSPLAYWAGKMAVALLLAIAAGLLAFLPGLLLGRLSVVDTRGLDGWGVATTIAQGWKRWLVVLSFFVAASAVAGGAVRSRSGLLMLDVLMLPVAWIAVLFAFGGVWGAGTAEVVMTLAVPWLSRALIVALLVAGAIQVCVGRLETRRGHLLLSSIAWGGVLLLFAGGLRAFSAYVASAEPADLRHPGGSGLGWIVRAPRAGEPVLIEGISAKWGARFQPSFLLEAGGGFVRLGGTESTETLALSADGRYLARSFWAPFPVMEPFLSAGLGPSLSLLDLRAPGAEPRRLARDARGPIERIVSLSPRGEQVLLAFADRREIVDLSSGRTLARATDAAAWSYPTFLAEGSLRALRLGGGRATVLDWEVGSGQVRERGSIGVSGFNRTWYTSNLPPVWPIDDWRRLARFDAQGLSIHDPDGATVATLVEGWPEGRWNRQAGPLSDGRVGLFEEDGEGLRLRVWDASGRLVSDGRFEGRFPLVVGGEVSPGLLAVGHRPRASSPAGRAGGTSLVDLATARVVRVEADLQPAMRRWLFLRELDARGPEPGSLATRLFFGAQGLVSLDPATGARTVVVAPRDRRD